MLFSLALIFLAGLFSSELCKKIRIPGIVGMILTGMLIKPLIDSSIMSNSADLRKIALIIILIRAGLSLDLNDLKKTGRPAVLMSFLPASFEILGYILLAPYILGLTRIEAAVTGAVLAAVSPAVVVPRMVNLIEKGYGTDKNIPQLIIAGSSCDDIFVIVLLSTFMNIAQGGKADIMDFINIPVSIVLGIILGIICGTAVNFLFRHTRIRNSIKAIIILSAAFLLADAENRLSDIVSVSGLLAVISMACCIKMKSPEKSSAALSSKFSKLWLFAEILLFVLVGAAVDIRYLADSGLSAAAMVLVALVFRSAGTALCVTKTHLNRKEKLFCIIAYLPKATVQAATCSIPLAAGLSCGKTVLTAAVAGILITAPLGAFLIDNLYKKLLSENKI